jgi:hypothetical protein
MQKVQVRQCGICKTFHQETSGPCPACQAHKIYQLTADRFNDPAALRQSAQELRRKAEELEREASALESSMATVPSERVAPASPIAPDRATADRGAGELKRRLA